MVICLENLKFQPGLPLNSALKKGQFNEGPCLCISLNDIELLDAILSIKVRQEVESTSSRRNTFDTAKVVFSAFKHIFSVVVSF